MSATVFHFPSRRREVVACLRVVGPRRPYDLQPWTVQCVGPASPTSGSGSIYLMAVCDTQAEAEQAMRSSEVLDHAEAMLIKYHGLAS